MALLHALWELLDRGNLTLEVATIDHDGLAAPAARARPAVAARAADLAGTHEKRFPLFTFRTSSARARVSFLFSSFQTSSLRLSVSRRLVYLADAKKKKSSDNRQHRRSVTGR